eukprot:TRINITY_DN14591_c0_g1_i2.p1 TRINITY_DN14591_c0_g1~~TRINITY_DN14591_c0_g1_i2.p1  ORF type:complete len:419 (+),score=88.47 TRINITY_DN14591_c0_g1_i2:183-1439(+)
MKKKKYTDCKLPNLYPFKVQALEALERKKQEDKQDEKIKKLKSKELKQQIKEEIVKDGGMISEKYETNEKNIIRQDEEEYKNVTEHRNKRKFVAELNNLLESSDIILEILDARDPLGCRCKGTEAKIQSMPGNKKIILVLNKADLIPPENAETWIKYLKREYATVIFKSNTQYQQSHLGGQNLFKKNILKKSDKTKNSDQIVDTMLSSNKSVGAENLLELIKNYSKCEGIKRAVTIGVIGYPNVGKSSVINSLKKSKAAGVSSVAGFTKSLQTIKLDSQVKIIDSPGVIFTEETSESDLALRNLIKVQEVKDPRSVIDEILKKVPKEQLMQLYKTQDFSSSVEFLTCVAQNKGQLKKKGIPNLDQAARIVLRDWNEGSIKFSTLPPSVEKDLIEMEQTGQIEQDTSNQNQQSQIILEE